MGIRSAESGRGRCEGGTGLSLVERGAVRLVDMGVGC